MARGRKFKGGGVKAKPEAKVADVKVEQEEPAGKELGNAEVQGTADAPNGGVKSKILKKNGKRKRFRTRKRANADKTGEEKEVVKFAGLIFMCSSATKKDCFKYHVFGFPEARKDIVEHAKKGMMLFLFDIDQKVLHGVYKASSNGGMNLVTEAFQDSERKFPAQIRFRIHKDCAPLDESVFKPVLNENYHGRNKFKCELSYEQVGKLLQLFRPLDASGQPKPKSVIAKESRRQSFQRSSTARGARTGAAPYSSRNARATSAVEYPKSLIREPLPIELGLSSQPGYIPAHSLAYPDLGRLETDVLYRQRLPARADALERRALVVDPLVDASLRSIGLSGEFGRRRFPDDLHVDERSLLLSKGSLHHDLYRDAPYQREVLYSGQDNGHTYSGTLPYKPLTTLPWGYP